MKRKLRESKNERLKLQFKKIISWRWSGIIAITLLLFIFFTYWITKDLAPLTELEHFEPRLVTKVFTADSVVIKQFFRERRDYVPLKDIPHLMQRAVIDVEDKKFYQHWGMDLKRLAKAAFIDITHFSIREGASTLTQQLATALYYLKGDKWFRKIREAITAIQIERTYSKHEILEMYLNQIYFGHGNYGIKAAAQYYFNKDVKNLQLEECALLAGVLNLPAVYSPVNHPERALRKRNIVLKVMNRDGDITDEEYKIAHDSPIVLGENRTKKQINLAPYYTEYVRQILDKKFGSELYTAGYSIYTTLDSRAQTVAEKAVKDQLEKLQNSIKNRYKNKAKFRTFLNKYVPDSKDQEIYLSDEAKKDSLINAKATVQGALVAVDPSNGHILAMVGGKDFNVSKWNRAVQMERQPGSSFKPFIYTAVIDNGYPPTYELLNQPVVLFMPDGTRWIPRNFDRDQGGPMMLRDALKKSKNLISARILQEIVKPSVVVEYAKKNMGLTTNLRAVDALALGTSEVIPLEITSAYGIYPNKGLHVKPIAITKVVDRRGEVIYEEFPENREALSEQTAYLMTQMLQTVINEGTGVTARTVYNFRRPAGGKTGTTDDYTDAWFVGFTPQISAGVWVGFDDPALDLGNNQTGAVAALPIWANFMRDTHDSLYLPILDFEMPEGVIRLKICKESKQIASQYCPEVVEEVFIEKFSTTPTKECDIHTGRINRKDRRRKPVIF